MSLWGVLKVFTITGLLSFFPASDVDILRSSPPTCICNLDVFNYNSGVIVGKDITTPCEYGLVQELPSLFPGELPAKVPGKQHTMTQVIWPLHPHEHPKRSSCGSWFQADPTLATVLIWGIN